MTEKDTSESGMKKGELEAETKAHSQSVLKAVAGGVRASNGLPKRGENYELLQSFPLFAELLGVEAGRALGLVNAASRASGVRLNLSDAGGRGPEELLDRLVDANDALLEKVGNLLDEASGVRRGAETLVVTQKAGAIATSWNKAIHDRSAGIDMSKVGPLHPSPALRDHPLPTSSSKGKEVRLLAARNVPRPQLAFAASIDNSNTPFRSKLRLKHHARKRNDKAGINLHVDEQPQLPDASDYESYVHPYQYELHHLEPHEDIFKTNEPQRPAEVEKTEVTMVKTVPELKELLEHLLSVKVLACDLEAHDYRSFLGLTCLMQISTDEGGDFLVDTLALWNDLHILNEVFADPAILKVLHGADRDVLWLQRDFGIYIVGLFDTGQAMRVYGMPRFGLAHLVKHYADVSLEKQFQLADWRMRPLPDELIRYARSDTHWLLYAYRRLRNDLASRPNAHRLLASIWDRSRDIALTVYEKPLLNPDDHKELERRSRESFNVRQQAALRGLYEWRDRTARLEDESKAFVLPDHMLLHMAKTLPKELSGVLACCNPVPPLVKTSQQELHRIILSARALPMNPRARRPFPSQPLTDSVRRLPFRKLPHDYSHVAQHEALRPLTDRIKDLAAITTKAGDSQLKTKLGASLKAFDLAENGQSQAEREAQWARVRESVSELAESWASPYELFLLAEAAAAEREKEVPMGVGTESKAKDASGALNVDDLGDCEPVLNTRKATHDTDAPDGYEEEEPTRKAPRLDIDESGTDRIDMSGDEEDGELGDSDEDLPDGPAPKKRKPKRNKYGKVFDAGALSLTDAFTPVDYTRDQHSSNDVGGRRDVWRPHGGRGRGGRGGNGRGGRSRGRGGRDSRGGRGASRKRPREPETGAFSFAPRR